MSDQFPYQRILITGATSGIGQALANRIIESSPTAHVIASGRRKEALQSLVQTHGSDRVTAEQFDVSDLAALPAWTRSLVERFPDLDAVILNAGFQHMPKIAENPESVDLSRIADELHTNYLSPVQTTTLLLPHFKSQSRPCAVILVGSGLGIVPSVLCPTYSASKAAIHSFAWTLRANLAQVSSHIRVVEIIPPAVKTELHSRQGLSETGMELIDFLNEAWEGLTDGKEEVPVGMAKERTVSTEGAKKVAFEKMTEMMRKQEATMKQNK